MGMTIDNAIKHGKEQLHIFGKCDHADFIKCSIDTMRKYKKIEKLYKKYLNDIITNIYADRKLVKSLSEVLKDGSE